MIEFLLNCYNNEAYLEEFLQEVGFDLQFVSVIKMPRRFYPTSSCLAIVYFGNVTPYKFDPNSID